jgi:ubiquinone/menaquinone biosynthesis C-methylase UbiE
MNTRKNILIMFSLFVLCFNLSGQTSQTHVANQNQKQQFIKEKLMNFLELSAGDKVLDLGSGTGANVTLIASFYPNMVFSVEDIDSTVCNRANFQKEINKTRVPVNVNNFKFHYGNEKSTLLPNSSFTKVMMFDLVHEFTYKKEMFQDIKRILKKDGLLLISEIVVNKKVPKEKDCNYPFLTEPELKDVLLKNNIIVLHQEVFSKLSSNKNMLLLRCKFL